MGLQQGTRVESARFGLPAVEHGTPGQRLTEWLATNVDAVNAVLDHAGAILFKGFGVTDPEYFANVATRICSRLITNNGEHVPVTQDGKVQRPVDYPPTSKLLWHNENSFNRTWPTKIMFGCLQPALKGGESLLVDSRRVYQEIAPEIKERFVDAGVMYVRTYGQGFGLDWRTVFRTDSRADVERACHESDLSFEWIGDDLLKTSCVRPAVQRHPRTGEYAWFCQIQHWHLSCLDAETREMLLSLVPEAQLPRNCFYGDGSRIPDAVVREIYGTYERLEQAVALDPGDVLLVDNILTAHGRNPYEGARKLLVALGDVHPMAS